ncbi:uncharacterized protein GGS25DRAFT_487377 [Hypoxylon fragiforme]|uniref:uncharacterized protein n=1 Tax=Hypoxylon fragiforme TaxID=63214 RepID=UPI0020C745D1|nr:uncharacterized protein GGS25DRAFT_487377 [Hypoxylon fragiforme]KAI2610085.1 hypothetical protein GGS25DRAFT_487377 [Hypoxylon fragiforme]
MADEDPGLDRSAAGRWFSSDINGAEGPWGWRLDVVTLLAVIGESSVAEHAQTITASIFCLFPRIVPAPQAFLKPSRPLRLPETTAKMTGVYSGVVLDTVGFFANIIHPLDELSAFSFRVLRIKHTDRNNAGGVQVPASLANGSKYLSKFYSQRRSHTSSSHEHTSLPRPPLLDEETKGDTPIANMGFSSSTDVEAGPPVPGITKRITMREKMQDFAANPTLATTAKRPAIPAKLLSPVHILSIFSVVLTASIIGFAAHYQDGTAILAVSLIALASSVVGWASWWKPVLMHRSHNNKVPEGDMIIRTRKGAFLLVKCTEEVARELYSGTEECEYHVSSRAYRVLMGTGTCVLMVSVILLGNCKWNSQIFIGASYITLNGLYWALGLLPKRFFWDLGRYDIQDITPPEAQGAETTTGPDQREDVKSFTRTLWYAIRETKRTAWVNRSGAAPITPQWRTWLAEAEQAANRGEKKWPAVARKDDIMKMSDAEIEDLNRTPVATIPAQHLDDEAKQAVPAVEVQIQNSRPADGTL